MSVLWWPWTGCTVNHEQVQNHAQTPNSDTSLAPCMHCASLRFNFGNNGCQPWAPFLEDVDSL
jgi:hypothetical protein